MEKKDSIFVVNKNTEKYIGEKPFLFLINPFMSNLEALAWVQCFRRIGFEDEKNFFLEMQDAIDIILDEIKKNKSPFDSLFFEILKILKAWDNFDINKTPVNSKTFPDYVESLLKCYPELKTNKKFKRYFIK